MLKKFLKKFKKVLDNEKKVWYNSRAVRKEAESERSLKIEQQERSTKHSMCERTDLVNKSYIYSTKVKEAKKK